MRWVVEICSSVHSASFLGFGPLKVTPGSQTKDIYVRSQRYSANTASSLPSSYQRPWISAISMEPCTYKRVLLTVSPSRLLQTRKTLKRISERLKLWMHSVFHIQMLVEVQDASSGSESTRLSSEESSLTRHGPITCQSSGINSANNVDLPLSEPSPDSHSQVHNEGDNHRDRGIPEEDFWVSLFLSCVFHFFAK